MNNQKKHWGIVGGGMLGMQLANRLTQEGHQVTLMEAAPQLGGLTSAWQLGDAIWDKYYHVILLSDAVLRGLLSELGIENEAEWVETKTGFYTDGRLYSMSNTLEFLRFPPLSLIDKFRLGFSIFYASRVKNWKKLEGVYVADWLKMLAGKNTFNKIWLPLLRAKLGENYRHTSAAFIWATIQRMYAARRTGLKKEMFGYVKGGYARILDVFQQKLLEAGVVIETGYIATKVYSDTLGKVAVENQQGATTRFDEVILTIPSSVAAKVCHGLNDIQKMRHENIEYLGVICASLLLKKQISPFYVTNVTDDAPFTGVIEMTNLIDPAILGGHSLIYLPKYVKADDPAFSWTDQEIKDRFWNRLKEMYDFLSDEDLISIKIARTPRVFALSTIGYSEQLPPISTNIPGVHILNSAHIANGTLNVNETLQLVDQELPTILEKAKMPQYTKKLIS